ncbi:MAG TPA: metallophosphoesterase family protein [Candidatus Dormibacteraeota bacterium]|nr:metallophosphoesterase family protein [Candidatus Dormibacteraeota bacterium]
MVRLGLLGDTQGRYRVEALLAAVRPHLVDVDEIWHAGDWQDEQLLVELRALGVPLTVVNGNAPDDPRYPERVVRRIEALTVAMVHRPPRLDEPWVRACQIVIHGHTHRWRDEVVDGVRFINVGSATAAGFSRERTIGLLAIDGPRAHLTRIDLPTR